MMSLMDVSIAGRRAEPTGSARRTRGSGRTVRKRGWLTPYLFIAPGFALFLLTIVYPTTQALQMSFFDWKIVGSAASEFIGLDNYARAFGDPQFWASGGNTVVYIVATVIPQILIGLAVALLLHLKSPAQPLFRVLYYLPVVTSWVVVSLLFRFLFADEGLINFTLGDILGVTDGDTAWLADRWTGMAAISALGIWKGIGWSMMIFLAALQSVPQSLIEAATVDGANTWQRFRVVTLPTIWAALAFVTVMLVIGGFNVFISVYLMTGGGPAGRTQVLLTYMYQQAFEYLDLGYGAAIGVLLMIVVYAFSVVQLRGFRGRYGDA